MESSVVVNKSRMRQINRNRILGLIRNASTDTGIAQVDLVRQTGLSSGAVATIVAQLKQDGLVIEDGLGTSTTGKRPVLLKFDHTARYVLAIELVASHTTIAILDMAGHVQSTRTCQTDPRRGPEAVLADIADQARNLLARHDIPHKQVLGVGVAIEAAVIASQRLVTLSVNLGWQQVPVGQMLEDLLAIPVIVEGTAVAMLNGEYLYGIGRHSDTVIVLDLDAGIGAMLMLDGRLVRGSHSMAGELGHCVVEPDGELCTCGRRGCLETVASPRAITSWIARQLCDGRQSILQGNLSGDDCTRMRAVFNAADDDALAGQAVGRVIHYAGLAVSSMISMIDPDMVILTGMMTYESHGRILEGIRRAVHSHVLPDLADRVRVEEGVLREQAALIGAAAMVCEQEFRVPV